VGGGFRDYEYQHPMHMHDEMEILVALQGPIYIYTEKENYTLNKGDVVLINSRVPHTTIYAPYACTNMLQFRLDKIETLKFSKPSIYLSYLLKDNRKDMIFFDNTYPLANIISNNIELILTEKEARNTSYEMYMQAYTELIIAALYRNNILKDNSDILSYEYISKIWPIIKYIDENYNKKLSLDFLSNMANMNKSHLCRLFKKALNITIVDYINYVRVWNAENLLTTTYESILEISMEVGFSNLSYFNRVFKNLKGITPSAYKNVIYTKNEKPSPSCVGKLQR